MKILNMDSFGHSAFHREPWEWGILTDLLELADVATLRADIMRLEFRTVSADRSDKGYRMRLFEVAAEDTGGETRLDDLCRELRSDVYIEALGSFAGTELRGRRRTINLWKYAQEDYLSPHVDKPEKHLTQLLYFSEIWPPSDGGNLNILSGPDAASVVASIAPQYQSSAVIKTGENSWHSVSPVLAQGAERYCLQFVFWND